MVPRQPEREEQGDREKYPAWQEEVRKERSEREKEKMRRIDLKGEVEEAKKQQPGTRND